MKRLLKPRNLLLALGLLIAAVIGHAISSSEPVPHANIQMSRIDFSPGIDDSQAAEIRKVIMGQEATTHCFVNAEAGTVTYAFDRSRQSSQRVFGAVEQRFPGQAKPFVVTEEMASSGCPVTGKNSVFRRASAALSGLFAW